MWILPNSLAYLIPDVEGSIVCIGECSKLSMCVDIIMTEPFSFSNIQSLGSFKTHSLE